MKILAVDQARNSGWSVFNYDDKVLIATGSFSFPSRKYDFQTAIQRICDKVLELATEHNVNAVFLEDVMYRFNMDSFKKLSQLQGALIYMLESHGYLYHIVAPSAWQGYCKARDRTSKEVRAKVLEPSSDGKKATKQLSIQFVKDNFDITTTNDNLADAICIGFYAVNNINLVAKEEKEIMNE